MGMHFDFVHKMKYFSNYNNNVLMFVLQVKILLNNRNYMCLIINLKKL
jgi:hypothetical protein